MHPPNEDERCVICESEGGTRCQTFPTGGDRLGFSCECCGKFEVSRTAMATDFGRDRLTRRQRAALSHYVRNADRRNGHPVLNSDWLKRYLPEAKPPNPALQRTNLVRVIGDHISETGEGYFIDGLCDAPLVGALNQTMFDQLVNEMMERKLLVRMSQETRPNPRSSGVLRGMTVGLSLDGWELYETERRGQIAGRYGFLAMQFNDEALEAFAATTLKPAIDEALGYQLVDLRDVSRAGVIDNLLREQIRNSAFVIADLTHDNYGAYWEAGYAEGLGKPVIYICERSKFDEKKTHFDTNHSMTVPWSLEDSERFVRELIATIRRSLMLFENTQSA